MENRRGTDQRTSKMERRTSQKDGTRLRQMPEQPTGTKGEIVYEKSHFAPRTEREARNQALGAIVTKGRERFADAQAAGEIPEGYIGPKLLGEDAFAAREAMIETNLELVGVLAKRFHYRGIEPADLQQEGNFALMKAIDRYNPEMGSFSGYATATIVGELKRVTSRESEVVYFPRRITENRPLVMSTDREMETMNGQTPSSNELAQEVARRMLERDGEIDPTEEDIAKKAKELLPDLPYLRSKGHSISLFIQPPREDAPSLEETLPHPTDDIETATNIEALREIFQSNVLDEREKRALYLYYWGGMTQARIATEELGVSQMHVSRIINRAAAKIRKKLEE